MMRGETGYQGHDILDKVLGHNFDLDEEGRSKLLKLMNECYSATGEAKVKGTCEFLNDLLSND